MRARHRERLSFGRPEAPPDRLFLGDNLTLLRSLPDASVDLVYADPPFGTGREQRGENGRFADRPAAAAHAAWLRPRLVEVHRVLQPTGSLFLHLDWRSSHHARLVLDEVFGEDAFRNEIVWHYGLGGSRPRDRFPRKHDTILFYARGPANHFHPQRGEVTPAMAAKYAHEDERGRYMHAHGRRYYLRGGKLLDDVWEVPSIAPGARERVGYPTQKPEALLERIVRAASSRGDVVLDPFAGSGTTLVVAQRLGRRFLGCDRCDAAIAIAGERLRRQAVELPGEPPPDVEIVHLLDGQEPPLDAAVPTPGRNLVLRAEDH